MGNEEFCYECRMDYGMNHPPCENCNINTDLKIRRLLSEFTEIVLKYHEVNEREAIHLVEWSIDAIKHNLTTKP